MLYDLNVLWPQDSSPSSITGVKKTLAVLQDLGYTTVALNVVHSGAVSPKNLSNPIDKQSLQTQFPKLTILSRITLVVSDASQNYNLQTVYSLFDLVAIRPLTEKALQSAATALDIDIISIDCSHRLPFFLKFKTACTAVDRGVKLEICYAGSTSDARKHIITNAAQVIRASRKRGIIASSESSSPLVVKSPYDVTNLLTVWGLDHMRARDAVGRTASLVVKNAALRNSSFKQVVQVTNKRTGESEPKEPSKKLKTKS